MPNDANETLPSRLYMPTLPISRAMHKTRWCLLSDFFPTFHDNSVWGGICEKCTELLNSIDLKASLSWNKDDEVPSLNNPPCLLALLPWSLTWWSSRDCILLSATKRTHRMAAAEQIQVTSENLAAYRGLSNFAARASSRRQNELHGKHEHTSGSWASVGLHLQQSSATWRKYSTRLTRSDRLPVRRGLVDWWETLPLVEGRLVWLESSLLEQANDSFLAQHSRRGTFAMRLAAIVPTDIAAPSCLRRNPNRRLPTSCDYVSPRNSIRFFPFVLVVVFLR